MQRSVIIARIGATVIRIHPVWLAGVPLLGCLLMLAPHQGPLERAALALQPLAWALCILAHEAGHAVVARALGAGVRGVGLMPVGGVTEFAGDLRPGREELLVSAAGPTASAGLAGAALLASAWAHGPVRDAGHALALFNAAVFAVNALPALPLDGGRALRALLFGLHGGDQARATALVGRLSIVSGYALGGLAGAALRLRVEAPLIAVGLCGSLLWTGWVLVRQEARGRRERSSEITKT